MCSGQTLDGKHVLCKSVPGLVILGCVLVVVVREAKGIRAVVYRKRHVACRQRKKEKKELEKRHVAFRMYTDGDMSLRSLV